MLSKFKIGLFSFLGGAIVAVAIIAAIYFRIIGPDATAALNNAYSRIRSLEGIITELNSDLDILGEKHRLAIGDLEASLGSLRRANSRISTLEGRLSESDRLLKESQRRLSEIEGIVGDYIKRIRELTDQIDLNKDRIRDLEGKLGSSADRIRELEAETAQYAERIRNLESSIGDLEDTIARITSIAGRLQSGSVTTEERLSLLRGLLAGCVEAIERVRSYQKELSGEA